MFPRRLLSVALAIALLPTTGLAGIYFGNFHSHTRYSDGQGTPAEAFTWARDTAGFDFYAITDHAEQTSNSEWTDLNNQANAFNVDGTFVAIRGFEWANPGVGHVNVFGTTDRTNLFQALMSIDSFYSWIDSRNAIAIFNHPGDPSNTFGGLKVVTKAVDNMVGLETANSGTNLAGAGSYYVKWLQALDKGWKVAPHQAQDNHSLSLRTAGRTAVIANGLTRAAILDAVRARRVYSTDSAGLQLSFAQNGVVMGGDITAVNGNSYYFDVSAVDDGPIKRLELVTNGGAVLASYDLAPYTTVATWSPMVVLSGQTYVFLRVTMENLAQPGGYDLAYTAPIFVKY